MKLKLITSCLAGTLLSASVSFGQTTIAKWTFETSPPADLANNTTIGVVSADVGAGTATGVHASANSDWSTPVGNGSANSLSVNDWTVGDYWQFQVSTLGYSTINLAYDQTSSGTGPGRFNLFYSTDGVNFTQFGGTSNILANASPNPVWSASTYQGVYFFSIDLSSITAINNAATVYFRLVNDNTTSANGGTVASGGTSRVDNFTVTGVIPGAPTIVTQPQTINAYSGDSISFSVTSGGDPVLAYQWYYTNSTTGPTFTALVDGSSGFGFGMITNSTNFNLTLTYLNVSQAGGYRVVVTNLIGSVTSLVANLNIGVRTPIVTNIAYLRTLQTANWFPSDTTNLYSITGTVTTPINMTAASSRLFYMQDGSGTGIPVFVGGGTYLPDLSNSVTVIGPMGQFNGLLQLNLSASNPTHFVNFVSANNAVPSPKYFSIDTLTNISFVETNIEASLVVVSNVFFQLPQVAGFVSVGSLNMTNVNGKILQLFVNANASSVITQPVPPFAASVSGVFGQFTSATPATNNYQLNIMEYAGLVSAATANIPFAIQQVETNAVLTWNASLFSLQSSTNVAGPYVDITPSTSPYTNYNSNTNDAMFFRLVR